MHVGAVQRVKLSSLINFSRRRLFFHRGNLGLLMIMAGLGLLIHRVFQGEVANSGGWLEQPELPAE